MLLHRIVAFLVTQQGQLETPQYKNIPGKGD